MALRLAVQQGHGHHVGDDLLVREQPDLLDDVADAAAQLDRVDVGDVLAVEHDPARGGLDQPVDHLQRRRLAAAGRADQADHLAALHVEVELVHRDRAVGVGLAHALAAGSSGHRTPRRDAGSGARGGSVHAVTLLATAASGSRTPTACYSRLVNEWFCGDYFTDRKHELIDATVQHIWITIVSRSLLGLVHRLPARAARPARCRASRPLILGVSTGIYTIPSLALFPLLVPFTGISADHRGHRPRALLAHDPGAEHCSTACVRCPTRCVESATRSGLRPPRLLLQDRAAARAARDDGRPAGRHRLDGRADHGRRPRGVRRARQPDRRRRQHRLPGRAAGRLRPLRAARGRCSTCCSSVLQRC